MTSIKALKHNNSLLTAFRMTSTLSARWIKPSRQNKCDVRKGKKQDLKVTLQVRKTFTDRFIEVRGQASEPTASGVKSMDSSWQKHLWNQKEDGNRTGSHHFDELRHGHLKLNYDRVRHILHGSDVLVITGEDDGEQPVLGLGAGNPWIWTKDTWVQSWLTNGIRITLIQQMLEHNKPSWGNDEVSNIEDLLSSKCIVFHFELIQL